MQQRELLSLALTRIQDGSLPRCQTTRTYAGNGREEDCIVCSSPITTADIEYEVPHKVPTRADDGSLHFHFACYNAWIDACRTLES